MIVGEGTAVGERRLIASIGARPLPAALGMLARPMWALPLLLVALALGLTLPRLTTPPVYVFDERYYAYTAGKFVSGAGDAYQCCVPPRADPAIEWTHPPLAKLLIAGGIRLFSDEPLGWRVASVLFGAAGIVVTFLLAKALTADAAAAFIAAALLLCDGLYVVESRTGMSNLFLLVFANAALLAFSRVLADEPGRQRAPLLATGSLLGLAIATKWSAVALLGLVGAVYGARAVRHWRRTRISPAGVVGIGIVALVVVPAGIYLLSCGHFFLTGHDWSAFVSLQRSMLDYHRNLGVVHPYSSPWWEWPMAARPVWCFADRQGAAGAFVYANGNPLLYWPMAVAVGWLAIDWWGRRPAPLAILLIGFFGQWLPWALSPRGTFVYHFLPVVPLGCVALAMAVIGAWRRGGWG